jgi:ABC-2 type transport system ATP-binding protein
LTPAVVVRGFKKAFRTGLLGRRSQAVVEISFEVEPGEIFGFLGPNGAGKTTTIKALLGLIRPDAGELRLLGHAPDSMGWRTQVGYLPEHPNFYDFLTGFELVVWFARLSGRNRHEAEEEAKRLLERVGLGMAMHRRLRGYSKGMLQRAGLAQAMVASPKLLILDEPMTGLDPIGRKEIRELIVELKSEGRTIFYSTHILPDVEKTCDRVAIVHQGRLHQLGRLEEILADTTRSVTVRLGGVSSERSTAIIQEFARARPGPDWIEVEFPDLSSARRFTEEETKRGAVLELLEPNRDDLESIFMRALGGDSPGIRKEQP